MGRSAGPLERGGVRLRASLAATLLVALVLAAASVAFIILQRHELLASLTDVARQQASDAAGQASREGTAIDFASGGGDQSLIQVVAGDGSVVAASPSVDGEAPVVDVAPPPGEVEVVTTSRLPIGEGESFVVVAQGTQSPDGPLVVLAAQSLETVEESTVVVRDLLLLGCPVVLLLVGLTSYWLTGRALVPVEAMRRRVASIDGTSALSARVPVPVGNDEIARLAQTMNSMLGRLEASANAQRQFVGDASHELRSPLAAIRAAHEIYALHPETTSWPDLSAEVLSELDRVDRLVADLLLLARSDERGLTLRMREVDLDDLVRAEATRLRRIGGLGVVVAAPPVRAMGDPDHLARALRNLADNAARHARGDVELHLSATNGAATIDVIDDGDGVPSDDQDFIFERFARLDGSRARDSGGSGLGLPIARQIALAHGGDVTVGRTGAQTIFSLTIPLDAVQTRQRP